MRLHGVSNCCQRLSWLDMLFLCFIKRQNYSVSYGWYGPPLAPPAPAPNAHPTPTHLYNSESVVLVEFRKMSQNPAILARWLN